MTTRKGYNTLILMPYFPINNDICFENLKLWSFENNKDLYIKDVNLKDHIQKLVNCYKYHNNDVVKNPSIISIKSNYFPNPTNKTINKIEVLKNVLLFASILENNSWSFTTSDNFEVFYQRFNVGDENISINSGAIHHILAGGYKIDKISFIKPDYINIPHNLGLKGSIIKALETCLIDSESDNSKSQIIQSLNPFFNSYRNGSEHSLSSRVLLLIMAFELLFGETGRSEFKKNIQKYSSDLSIPRPSHVFYKYPIYNYGKITSYEQLSLSQIWAEEFYKLRHKIIHGTTVYDDDFLFKDLINLGLSKQPHFYIAINFFVVCLLNKLRELGFSSVPHFIINPYSKSRFFDKNISGIKKELFRIENMDLYDMLSKSV